MINFSFLKTIVLLSSVVALGGCSYIGGLRPFVKEAPAPELPEDIEVTAYTRIKTPFVHTWNNDLVFPFTSGAAIDHDNDGTMEVFVSGGHNQADALLAYRDGELIALEDSLGLSMQAASYGATAIDHNDDGLTDLLVARDDGVWIHTNNGGTFDSTKIDYGKGDTETPLAVAVADIDQDGDIDLYISNFISYPNWVSATFNDAGHISYNRLLRNNGDMTFTDITESSGTAGTQNTFLSVFSDLDEDGLQDLIVSNNTGRIEILHNNGDGTFTKNSYDSGLGFWMGIGVGDIDSDGDQDIAISNVSNTIPNRFLRGDLTKDQVLIQEWVLLRNDGDRAFTDITEDYGLTRQGFGWGIVFEDLNLDGDLDLLAGQSYVKWPPHRVSPLSGRAMVQVKSDTGAQFLNAPVLNLGNPNFGQSAVIADLNGDAKQDVVWVNMDGPVIAGLNENAGDVVTLAVPESAKWLGARVTAVSGESSRSYTREVTNAVGMQSDQSPHISFAVPSDGNIESLEVQFADGTTQTIAVEGPGLVQP